MKIADSDPAPLRQSTAAMKELICVANWDKICLGIRAITDLRKMICEVFFTNSCCPGAKVPPSEQGWNPAGDYSWVETRDTNLSLSCLALIIIAPCLQDHCPSVKLDWKWADGLLVWGNDMCKPCVKKIKFKITRLKAKILLCTHFFLRVKEKSVELWQVSVTLLLVFLERD